jgi:hypothetical protein
MALIMILMPVTGLAKNPESRYMKKLNFSVQRNFPQALDILITVSEN